MLIVYTIILLAYFKYVDDTCILLKCTGRQAEVVIHNLNRINKKKKQI